MPLTDDSDRKNHKASYTFDWYANFETGEGQDYSAAMKPSP